MNYLNYFPVTLASGEAFCNRAKEIAQIKYNIKHNIPTLLVSPRRYGKTSLALKTFEIVKRLYVHIDFYKALNEEDVSRFILNGIGQLLGQLEGTPQKLIKSSAEFFSGFHLKFLMGKYGLAVEFGKKSKSPVDSILMGLERIEMYAKKKEKKVIIFMDEFQTIAEITENYAIEAAIREAVQKAKYVNYVFSGSNRHLIEEMFDDKKRPFYKLCDNITLNRIHIEAYKSYIQMAAEKRWHKLLDEQAFDIIMALTKQHSYYVNKLCFMLWQNKKPPTLAVVMETWEKYVLENKSNIERELALLSLNQRRVLIYLANEEKVEKPFAREYASEWKMPTTSIHRAMDVLLEKDYVFIDEKKQYRILDPLIRDVLREGVN